MREKTQNQAYFPGPVKIEDIERASMYRDYLANWSSVIGRQWSVKRTHGSETLQRNSYYTDDRPPTTND